jgi:hypothetical protein
MLVTPHTALELKLFNSCDKPMQSDSHHDVLKVLRFWMSWLFIQVDEDGPEAHAEHDEHGKAEQKHPRRWLSRWLHKREHGKQNPPAPLRPLSAKGSAKKEAHQGSKPTEGGKPAGTHFHTLLGRSQRVEIVFFL